MDEKIWRNCFLLCACRTQGRHWVHWLLQICKARSIYYSWGRSAQKRPFQYHWKIDKLTSDLYNPESFCLVTRFDNFGWNPFLIFPDLIRITLCSEKIGEAEAVKSKNLVWSKVYPSYISSRHCTFFQERGSDWAGGLLSDCEKKALLNENFVSENFSLSLINLRKTSWFLWFVFTEEQQLGLQSSLSWMTRQKEDSFTQPFFFFFTHPIFLLKHFFLLGRPGFSDLF